MKLTRHLIKINESKVFVYIPVDILKEISYNSKKQYEVKFWMMGKIVCLKLIESVKEEEL